MNAPTVQPRTTAAGRPRAGGRRPPPRPASRWPTCSRQAGHHVDCCSSAAEALQLLDREELRLHRDRPEDAGHERRRSSSSSSSSGGCGAQVVMVTAHASVATAVEAMRHGAFDYIEKPFDVDQLEQLVGQAIRHGRLVRPDAAGGERRAGRRPTAGDDRLQPGHAGPARADRPGRAHARNRADHRRERHGQGTGRPGDPRRQRPPRRPAGQPQLPGALGPPDGKRTVRARARGVHRGRRPADRPLRAGRRRHDPAGRSHRDRPAAAGQAAPRAPGAVVRAGRLERDASTSTSACWPPRTATCRPRWPPAGSARTCTSAWPWCRCDVPPLRERREDVPELVDYFLARCAERLQREPVHARTRRPGSCCSSTTGRATSASWRTSSPGPACSTRRAGHGRRAAALADRRAGRRDETAAEPTCPVGTEPGGNGTAS